jgi:DNA-binding CsgD family transcriptional regulator
MLLATKGLTNKEIARQLGISSRTVENHRAHVMEKMRARNIAELCRMAALCLPPDEQPMT